METQDLEEAVQGDEKPWPDIEISDVTFSVDYFRWLTTISIDTTQIQQVDVLSYIMTIKSNSSTPDQDDNSQQLAVIEQLFGT